MPVSASLANQRLQSRSSLALPQAQRCSDSGSGPEGTADSTLLAQLDSITSLVLTAFGGNANNRNLPLYNQKNIKKNTGCSSSSLQPQEDIREAADEDS